MSISRTRRFAVRFAVRFVGRFAAGCRFGLFHGFDVTVRGTGSRLDSGLRSRFASAVERFVRFGFAIRVCNTVRVGSAIKGFEPGSVKATVRGGRGLLGAKEGRRARKF
ncbi:unnamed protein product, partial [Ectocarpus sp. 12 AP-2014]